MVVPAAVVAAVLVVEAVLVVPAAVMVAAAAMATVAKVMAARAETAAATREAMSAMDLGPVHNHKIKIRRKPRPTPKPRPSSTAKHKPSLRLRPNQWYKRPALTARMTAPTAVTTDKVSWTDTKEIGRGHRMVSPYLFLY